MAIKDTNIQKLIINRLTQEKYEELLASDQINDNELYITDSSAESEYSKEEVDVLLSEKANLSDTYTKTEVDEKISDLNIPTQVSQLTNDLGFITATEIENKASVSYVDEQLNKKADKTDIPSLVSQLTNDVGYITQHQDISGKADITYVNERLELKADKSDTYTKTEVDSLLENFEPIGETLPSQADNAGKFLTTDGTSASWDSIGKFTDNIDSVSLDLNKVIINRITQSEYNILAENGQLKEDEIYVTDAEAYTKAEVDELLSSQKSFIGDEITVITTEDDKAQAIGVIEKNKSKPKYDWVGTLAEYQSQAVATNHPDWVCYITDDNTADAYEAYSKTETDELLEEKANITGVYTKTETDSFLNTKANITDVYTKTQTDSFLNTKANITDVYTKTETDKQTLTNLSMPSKTKYTDLTLGASGAIYTAPATGWFLIDKAANDQEYVYIGSNLGVSFTLSSSGSQGLCATIPVPKGKAISISYNASGQTTRFRFIYAIGAE